MLAVVNLVASDEVYTFKELLVVFKDGAFLNLISHYNDNKNHQNISKRVDRNHNMLLILYLYKYSNKIRVL